MTPKLIVASLEAHGGAVRRLARAIVGDDPTADDVLQETVARAIASANTFDPERGSPRTWLFAIARHAAFEQLRQRRERPVGDSTDVEALVELGVAAGWGGSPEVSMAHAERREVLARALSGLSRTDREILLLRDVEGIGSEDAARLLDIDVPAMKSRLHRARLRLVAAVRETEEGVVANDRMAGGVLCSQVLALLSEYVDAELGPTDRARIENHLRECSVCERFGGRFANVVHHLREQLGVTPALDAAVVEQIRARLG